MRPLNESLELTSSDSIEIKYHGKPSPYPFKKEIESMFEPPYDPKRYLFNPAFIDLGMRSDQELLSHRVIAGAELAFKYLRNPQLLKYIRLIGESLKEATESIKETVLRYLAYGVEMMGNPNSWQVIHQALPAEERQIMGTIAEHFIQEGEQKGKLEEKREIVRNMLAKNFELDAIKEITGISDQELAEILKRS